LVYVSYNRKMENRFTKIRELGSKGKRSNPLLLDEFQWESEWVDESCEPEPVGPVQEGGGNAVTWALVDEAMGATQGLEGRNLARAAAARAPPPVTRTYGRNNKRARNIVTENIDEFEDEEHDQHVESDPAAAMEEDEESAPTETEDGGFTLNVDLLD
jgi:hypothetical protein